MPRFLWVSIRTVLLIALAAASLAAPAAHAHEDTVRNFSVMTRNVYSGADLTPILNAQTLGQLLNSGAQVYNRMKATNFRARAKELADEIAQAKPTLIGLQEVALWRIQSPGDGPLSPATTVAFDFLKILRAELKARGQSYKIVSVFNGFDAEWPALFSTGLRDVRFTDRMVILARSSHHVTLSNARKGNYVARFSLPGGAAIGAPHYRRGWQAVDVTIDGRKFRFVNTHLEVLSASVRRNQLQELLKGPAKASGSTRVALVGDFNFAPGSGPEYNTILGAGFKDVWTLVNPTSAGPTCCQNANLQNASSTLAHRIDFVFMRGALAARSAFRVGESQADRTPSGLWPSDHAGVVARLRLQ